MKKRIITCLLVLALMLSIMAPMTVSATTVNDVYEYFLTMPMADYYKDDLQKLMKIVPCSDEQAAILLDYLKRVNEIAAPAKGNEPRNYTEDKVYEVINLAKEACAVVNVDVIMTWRTDETRLSPVDQIILEFIYNGEKIYEYDGDAIRKTGSDISPVALYTGFALLAAAAVAVVALRKKETV